MRKIAAVSQEDVTYSTVTPGEKRSRTQADVQGRKFSPSLRVIASKSS